MTPRMHLVWAIESYVSVWVIWWLGDMMGVLMVAPPLLIWLSQPPPLLSRLQSVEALLLLVLLLIACSLIFGAPELAGHGYYPASLAVIPFVVWGALRFEYFGAALATLLISALAAWGTAHGTGPFVAPSMVGSLVGWSIFANLMAMTGLLLAVASSDPVLLVRILRNLITNALHYTEHGGVLVSARRRQGAIRFQVWDTGWGIAPEHTVSIFREYFQVRRAQRSGHFGQGLGLFIVAQLAHLLGHPLTVRSHPGRGTVFSVDVPLCQEDHRPLAMATPLLPGIGQLHGQVWILDDDVTVLDALKGLLEDWGLHVAKATASRDMPPTGAPAPDLLIADYHLGTEDGLAVVASLRQRYPDTVFPVIIITATGSLRKYSPCRPHGMTIRTSIPTYFYLAGGRSFWVGLGTMVVGLWLHLT